MWHKRLWRFLVVLLLLGGISGNVFALTSDAPPLTLTEQEQAYFSQLDSLRVLTAPDVQPYIYQEDGVSVDILKHLCAAAGVELQLIPTESYSDALGRLAGGEAPLSAVKISLSRDDPSMVLYLDAPMQMVYSQQSDLDGQSSLTIAQLQEINFFYDQKYSFVKVQTYPTVQDCLYAVRGRQADLFLCDAYQLSVFADSFAARELTTTNIPQRFVQVGFGLEPNADPRLVSALQSAVRSFAISQLNTSLIRHQQYHELRFRLVQFVYKNPFELLCAITALFFVILLCIFVSFRIRAGQHQELRGYEESYRMLADTFGEAGIEYDYLNDRFMVFGGRRDRIDLPEIVEQVHRELQQGALRLSLTAQGLDELLQNNAPNQSYQVEFQCGMRDGSWNWFRMIYIVVCTSESHRRPIRLIGCLVDIEEERQEKERLLKIGFNDGLTGLLNRAAGEQAISQALAETDSMKVLLFLDIDYFKSFNDRYGHNCGDAVLCALGTAMGDIFAPAGLFCRWGGDEFLLLVQGDGAQPQALYDSLEQLQKRMSAFIYMDLPLPVTLSIGGHAAEPGVSFQTLCEQADTALYSIKNSGRNSFHVVYPASGDRLSGGEEVG